MTEKFDLDEILNEIKEDEAAEDGRLQGRLSQSEIQRLFKGKAGRGNSSDERKS